MADELAFFELLASSAVFEDAMARSKESFASTVKEISGGSAEIQRQMLRAQAAVDQATAALAAQRVEASRARFAAGQITAPALALAEARSQKATVTAAASAEEATAATSRGGGLTGLGGQVALLGALGVVGGAAVGLAMLDKLVQQTAQYSSEVLRNAGAIGLNNQDMQLWDEIAQRVGLDQETLVRSIGHFNKEIADGAPTLRASRITLQDLGITSNDTGTALLQAADYFHSHRDAVQNDQIAMDLFGRSGISMLPILQQGSAAIRAYGEELKSFGIIMTDAQLATGAATEAVHNRFMEALKGLEGQLAVNLEPAFIQLYQTITTVTVNGGNAFEAMAKGIASVVGFIAGLIAGLTGAKVVFGDVGKDAGAAFDGLGGAATDAAGAIDGSGTAGQQAADALKALKAATREETEALTDQVNALNAQKQAFDDGIEAQKSALQDQLSAETRVIDGQRRQGEDITSYRRRLAEDNLKSQIAALDKEKGSKDKAFDEQIKALDLQKQALQQHLADEEAAVSSATGSMSADYAGAAASASSSAAAIKQAFDTSAFETGQTWATTLKGIFTDPRGVEVGAALALGTALGNAFTTGVNNSINLRTMDFFLVLSDFGVDMAKLGKLLNDFSSGQWWALPGDAAELANALGMMGDNAPAPTPGNGTLGSYADGTIITRDQLAMLHSPEAVIPLNNPMRAMSLMRESGLDRLAASGSAGAGSQSSAAAGGLVQNNSVTFNGPVADEYVASKVTSRLARELQRKASTLRGGIG